MKTTETILDQILVDVRKEVADAQRQLPLSELRAKCADVAPIRSFRHALNSGFGLIAEIKERSPSHGPMRRENIDAAAIAYEHSAIVRGISVLTNASHFGMSLERMQEVKNLTSKPVLRKDFIFDPYQVWQARAFGADAVLLMANLLEPAEMRELYTLARELNLDALFECHTQEQIEQVPHDAVLYGINSRTFDARKNTFGIGRYGISSILGRLGSEKDLTIDEKRFELGQFLPTHAIKVAESGVHPSTVRALRDEMRYHAALVGTSLLKAAHGITRELALFEEALREGACPVLGNAKASSTA